MEHSPATEPRALARRVQDPRDQQQCQADNPVPPHKRFRHHEGLEQRDHSSANSSPAPSHHHNPMDQHFQGQPEHHFQGQTNPLEDSRSLGGGGGMAEHAAAFSTAVSILSAGKRDRSPPSVVVAGPPHENKITAEERVKTLKCGSFYAENGRLYCRPCGQMVNHLRKSTIDTHCVSQKHIRNSSEDAHLPQSSAGSVGSPMSAGSGPTGAAAPTGPVGGLVGAVSGAGGAPTPLTHVAALKQQRGHTVGRLHRSRGGGGGGGGHHLPTVSTGHHHPLQLQHQQQQQQQERQKAVVWREFARLLTSLSMPVCGGAESAAIGEFVQRRAVCGGLPVVMGGGGPFEQSAALVAMVPNIYEDLKEEVFDRLRNKQIAIQIDETFDSNDDPVLNILMADMTTPTTLAPTEVSVGGGRGSPGVARISLPFYLCSTAYLEENPTSGKIGKVVIECLKEYDVDLDRVLCLHTDNEPYMVKAYKDILSPLLPNCVHITCLSHITREVGQALREPFADVSFLLEEMREMLTNNGGRKGRLLRYLKAKRKEDTQVRAEIPPVIKPDDWTSWFEAVVYHSANALYYSGFIREEYAMGACASGPVSRLKEFFTDKVRAGKAVACARFLSACYEPLGSLKRAFQFVKPNPPGAPAPPPPSGTNTSSSTHCPQILRIHDLLETLQNFLVGGRAATTSAGTQSAAAATAAAAVAAATAGDGVSGEAAQAVSDPGGQGDPRYAVAAYAGDLGLPAAAERELRSMFADAFGRASEACTAALALDENKPGLTALHAAAAILDPNRVATLLSKSGDAAGGEAERSRASAKEKWEDALPFLRAAPDEDYELYERYALNDTADGRLHVGAELFWRVRAGELGPLGRSALAFVASGAGAVRVHTHTAFDPYRRLGDLSAASSLAGSDLLARPHLKTLAFLQWNLAAADDATNAATNAMLAPRVFPGAMGVAAESDDFQNDGGGSDELEDRKPAVLW